MKPSFLRNTPDKWAYLCKFSGKLLQRWVHLWAKFMFSFSKYFCTLKSVLFMGSTVKHWNAVMYLVIPGEPKSRSSGHFDQPFPVPLEMTYSFVHLVLRAFSLSPSSLPEPLVSFACFEFCYCCSNPIHDLRCISPGLSFATSLAE